VAKTTMVFGVLLAILGVAFFVVTGSVHKTALIPLWFGLGLLLCGVLANSDNPKKRMAWMHIAVTIGLVGFIFPAARSIGALVHGKPMGPALEEQLAMAVLCLVFTAMCVRSFIAARRERLA